LQERLQRENQKPKVSKSRASKSRKGTATTTTSSSTKAAAGKDGEEEVVTELVVEAKAAASPPRPRALRKKKASDLTMDDVVDTPPRSVLVAQRREAMNENKDVNWISLIGYNQIQAENEEKLYAKLNSQCNAKFREDLDAQVSLKKQAAKSLGDEVSAYRRALNQQFASYQTEDEGKLAAAHAETLKLKEIRLEQVAESEKKRVYQVLKRRKQELRSVQKSKLALAKEQREKKEKKEANMAKLKDMLIDNERQKALKEQQRLKEEEEAIRLQKEYAAMLLEQEEKRAQHLQTIQAKQQQKFMALINATADIREKAEEDAKRAEVELKRRQKEQDEKDRAKKERATVEQKLREKAIDEQIQEKMNKIRNDILEDKQYGKLQDKLHKEYLQEIEDLKADKLRKQQVQSLYLQQQIHDLELRKKEQKTEMSETEKALNKKLLDKVRNIRSSPNKREIMMKAQEQSIKINPKAPFQWRYQRRSQI